MVEDKQIWLDKDALLMIKVSRGNRDAYSELYSKHFSVVMSFALSLNGQLQSIEDIAQEVFYRIWKKRKEYKPTAAFKTFLFTYVKNVTHELQQQRPPAVANHFKIMVKLSDPEMMVQRKELNLLIEKAKSKLSKKQLQALELMIYSNISIHAAAKLTGCSQTVFRRRVCDAKKRLSVLLGHIRKY